MASPLVDLLDAITEARVANPQLKPSVLAALRLAQAAGHLRVGRLLTLKPDGSVREIIAHGEASCSEDEDLSLVGTARERREAVTAGPVRALPLGKGKQIHGVLVLEGDDGEVAPLLADLCLQWCALAEFASEEKAELIDENFQLREELRSQFSDRNIVCVSGAFRRVLDTAVRAASSTATVLIHGETGTGKELVARLIHDHSPRANGPFVPVNCGALSESLLESELFGHVKGAFTGAIADRKGRFEAANGGTIFLDELGEVSPGMQVRMLRVLQEMEIERVGDTRRRKLDVRVVAATNRVLEDEVRKGSFRADLYYRLNVVYLHVPPLRSRTEDIPHLVEHFVGRHSQRNVKYIEMVRPEVLDALRRYPWPGNVRELENCIEKMVVLAPGRELTADLLPIAVAAHDPGAAQDQGAGLASFEARLSAWMKSETLRAVEAGRADLYDHVRAKWERHLFAAVLESCGNNKSRAAQLLGITRNTLAIRLRDLSAETRTWNVD